MVGVCAIGASDRQAGPFFSRSGALKAFASIALVGRRGGNDRDGKVRSRRQFAGRPETGGAAPPRRCAAREFEPAQGEEPGSRDSDAATDGAAADDAAADDAGNVGAGGEIPPTDPAREGSAREVETGD